MSTSLSKLADNLSTTTNLVVLLIKKGVYPYEYMDIWERFDETSLPNKESFIVA